MEQTPDQARAPKINWEKVGYEPPEGERTESIFEDFFAYVDAEVREVARKAGRTDLDEGIGNLTLMLAEVAADMSAALELKPFSVLATDKLPGSILGRAVKLATKTVVFLNANKLVEAAEAISKVFKEPDWNQVQADSRPIAMAVFTLAHELGHIRQYQHLPGKFSLRKDTETLTDEQQLDYLSSTSETHAESVALRYFRRKQAVGGEIWRLLEISEIPADFMVTHMYAQATLEVKELTALLQKLPTVRKKEPRKQLQKRIAILYLKQQNLSERIAKMHQRLKSLSIKRA